MRRQQIPMRVVGARAAVAGWETGGVEVMRADGSRTVHTRAAAGSAVVPGFRLAPAELLATPSS